LRSGESPGGKRTRANHCALFAPINALFSPALSIRVLRHRIVSTKTGKENKEKGRARD